MDSTSHCQKRRRFQKWSNEPPRCRYHNRRMVEVTRAVPTFSVVCSKHHAKAWHCPVPGCHWWAAGQGECLMSEPFREKELRSVGRYVEVE